jgi:hypothetical protein
MDEASTTLLVALLGLAGVLVTGLLSYRQGQQQVRRSLEIEYDKDLRGRRIEHYLELWSLLAPLAKYPEPGELYVEDVQALAVRCKDWYFERGGLFLSSRTRDHYFDLLDGCKIVARKHAGRWPESAGERGLGALLEREAGWRAPQAIEKIAAAPLGAPDERVPDEVTGALRALGSALRASMANDVLTREDTVLRAVAIRAGES